MTIHDDNELEADEVVWIRLYDAEGGCRLGPSQSLSSPFSTTTTGERQPSVLLRTARVYQWESLVVRCASRSSQRPRRLEIKRRAATHTASGYGKPVRIRSIAMTLIQGLATEIQQRRAKTTSWRHILTATSPTAIVASSWMRRFRQWTFILLVTCRSRGAALIHIRGRTSAQ